MGCQAGVRGVQTGWTSCWPLTPTPAKTKTEVKRKAAAAAAAAVAAAAAAAAAVASGAGWRLLALLVPGFAEFFASMAFASLPEGGFFVHNTVSKCFLLLDSITSLNWRA